MRSSRNPAAPAPVDRVRRALQRADIDCPLTVDAVQVMMGCSRTAATKALSRLVEAGLAVRYQPGQYGPVEGA